MYACKWSFWGALRRRISACVMNRWQREKVAAAWGGSVGNRRSMLLNGVDDEVSQAA
jgi:hypothetical protein